MPIIMIYECVNCGTRTEEQTSGQPAPSEWASVTVGNQQDWFDTWKCLSEYAKRKADRAMGVVADATAETEPPA